MVVKGEFKGGEQYKYKYINGAFGSVNTKGEIVLNFYCEKLNLPKGFQITIDDDDNGVDTIIQNEDIQLVRELECGIIMNLDVAKSVYEFLGDTIKSALQDFELESEDK